MKYQLLLFFYVTIFTAYYLITPTPNPYHVTLKSFIFKRANFRGMSILHWISLDFMDFIGFHGFHGFHWISWISWICLYFIILHKDYMFHNSLGIFIGEENPWNPQQLSPNNFNDSTAWTCCTQNVYMYICCTIQSPTKNIISGSCTHLPQCLCSTA